MFTTELDTFVKKFHQLWNDGVTAHLDLDTRGGDAWIGLRVHLGQVPGPPHRQFYQEDPRKESPSRQRRRARRAAARQSNIENVAEMQANVVEQATDPDISENVAEEVAKEVAEEASNDHQVDDELCSNVEYDNKSIPQVDGASEELEILYTFESEFAVEDVMYTVEEVCTKEVEVELISRLKAKVGDITSAEHVFTIRLSPPSNCWQWPEMSNMQREILMNLRKGSSLYC